MIKISTRQYIAVFIGTLLAFALLPELALAGTPDAIEGGVTWLKDLLTSGIARTMAVIAIAVLGYLAFAGRLTWAAAGYFMVGIIFIFGGTSIVSVIIDAVS